MFLANENIPLKSIKRLRKSGYAVKAIIEECPGISDEEVLRIAQDEALFLSIPRNVQRFYLKFWKFRIFVSRACSLF